MRKALVLAVGAGLAVMVSAAAVKPEPKANRFEPAVSNSTLKRTPAQKVRLNPDYYQCVSSAQTQYSIDVEFCRWVQQQNQDSQMSFEICRDEARDSMGYRIQQCGTPPEP